MRLQRIVIHDYSGHPFQAQLSRALAKRGHVVQHQYSSSYESGHGKLAREEGDARTLSFVDVALTRQFAKYALLTRITQEVEYGWRALRAILGARPDVVVLCNIPLLANLLVAVGLRLRRQPYVFWHQDVYSAAIRVELMAKLGNRVGALVSRLAGASERVVARGARHVVAITDAFLPVYAEWGVRAERISIIPNWASIEEIEPTAKDRSWLHSSPTLEHVVLYSGTLGVKHDPSLLLGLAKDPSLSDTSVVVVTQGRGRAWLEGVAEDLPPGRLILHDYVDYAVLPQVLGSADVLIAILEPEASVYSVPSKILTYLCAGRPVVALMDPKNAVAQILADEQAGYVVPPRSADEFAATVRMILDDQEEATATGKRARAYAEHTFDIDRIATSFEELLDR